VIEFLIVDSPPRSDGHGDPAAGNQPAGGSGATVRELLRSATYWKLMLAMSLLFASVVMIGSHLAPMAIGWGVSPARAASLLGIYGAAAILGTPLFGWLADRVGGRMVLVILAVDLAILFGLMILQPGFPLLIGLAALMGLHIASAPAGFALIIGENFGSESFGRAYGILQLVNLPFSVASVPLAAWIFERTGSYANALLLHVGLLALAAVLVLTIRRPRVA
jgi:predicted MFS family arabinose efflux permease